MAFRIHTRNIQMSEQLEKIEQQPKILKTNRADFKYKPIPFPIPKEKFVIQNENNLSPKKDVIVYDKNLRKWKLVKEDEAYMYL